MILRGAAEPLGLPRVHADCDYLKPLRFEDVFEMHLLVKEKREKTVTYQIRFWRIEPGPAEEVAVGHVTVVCVGRGLGGALKSRPFPEDFAAHLEVAPASALRPPRS